MLAAFGVAAVAGLALAAAAGWELLLVGALCFAAAVSYSGGPWPYASAGLGELFVFTFFGLVATVGSTYVQDGRIVTAAVAAAVPVGLLAVAILVVNNLRDIETDAAAGKQTLAARIGDARTRTLYVLLLAVAFASVAAVASAVRSPLPVLAALAAPLAAGPLRVVRDRAHGRGLIPALAGTARLQLVFGVLLALGLALA
jgi:1,4-dihydroxy-2-naphthoate octaprenyltransferase